MAVTPKVLVWRSVCHWKLEKWIVAVRKLHNFLARILFTENTYNEKLLYTVLISTMNARNAAKRMLNRLKLGILWLIL